MMLLADVCLDIANHIENEAQERHQAEIVESGKAITELCMNKLREHLYEEKRKNVEEYIASNKPLYTHFLNQHQNKSAKPTE
jgi:signal recognition particle GTPase